MEKVRQLKLLAVLLISAFLGSSTLARAAATTNPECDSQVAYQSTVDTPLSGDQPLPFEEKEKEFEDNTESSDKDELFPTFILLSASFADMFDISATGTKHSLTNSFLSTSGVPLFLVNRSILC